MGYTSCGDPGEHEIKGPPGRCFAVELFEFQFMYEGAAGNLLTFAVIGTGEPVLIEVIACGVYRVNRVIACLVIGFIEFEESARCAQGERTKKQHKTNVSHRDRIRLRLFAGLRRDTETAESKTGLLHAASLSVLESLGL